MIFYLPKATYLNGLLKVDSEVDLKGAEHTTVLFVTNLGQIFPVTSELLATKASCENGRRPLDDHFGRKEGFGAATIG